MKILMVLPRFPFPLDKGDKLRAFHHIKTLSEQHEIYLFCISSKNPTAEGIQLLSTYCRKICWYKPSKIKILVNLFRIIGTKRPLQNAFFVFKKAKQKLQKFIEENAPDHLFFQLIRMADYAESHVDIPKTLDYQDAFSLGMLRRAKAAKFPYSTLLMSEHKRLKHAETKAFDKFDHKMIISSFDRTFIEHPERDQILIVKNGIDLDFFKTDPTIEKTADLLFVGNLEYPPNILAVNILLKDIMPKLVEKNPHIKLLISGANPPRSWFKHQSPNIQILANPKDIREAYHAAKIFVAPMMLGTGLQNKLLEAMAMKLPCITTPLANTGLQATENKEVLIAKTPDEMINHILFLQNNPSICFQLSEQAFEFVKSFSWKKELEKWM